ncbi:uncharacterized protein LOC113469368 [Diaphorina citri]|uniref:Neuropeptide Crz n=1 Tax=Diaphorina citri TaxID=121845 RepID=A0A2U9PFR1_DIACI|nr:uncharacterized protein LOC113469368 [Diaphorina citri]XP_026682811.1 uncharacterized protein LOC113469368 [Diaphorina citri]AWT50596.1 neuropeptide Crz [Diaphorina citri]
MKLFPAPRHLLAIFLLSCLLWETFLAQTFEFSRGWTNGRKRSLVMTSSRGRGDGGGEKSVLPDAANPQDIRSLCTNFVLDNFHVLKVNRLCRHWLSSQSEIGGSSSMEPRGKTESRDNLMDIITTNEGQSDVKMNPLDQSSNSNQYTTYMRNMST